MPHYSFTIHTASENALLLCLQGEPNPQKLYFLAAIAQQIKQQKNVVDYVPSYLSLLVVYQDDFNREQDKQKLELLATKQQIMATTETTQTKTHQIPVCYDLEFALDLAELAETKKLTTQQVVAYHVNQSYLIYALGFLPAFPFCGFVNQHIAQGRKATPRLKVPAGSVGIAGKQTGIYPQESPGGWNIIGRVPSSFFPTLEQRINLFLVGDKVQFKAISKQQMN